jgi:hypothetical protein
MVAIGFFTLWNFGWALATRLNKQVRNAKQIGAARAG